MSMIMPMTASSTLVISEEIKEKKMCEAFRKKTVEDIF